VASSGAEDDDPMRESRAYNHSIYLMVSMPYLLLGGVGLLFYRTVKVAQKKAQRDRSVE
jgi:hypothetical protein